MADAPKKRGPQPGYSRMTFDIPTGLRARLKVAAAKASAADNRTVTMQELLEKWADRGIAELEKKVGK